MRTRRLFHVGTLVLLVAALLTFNSRIILAQSAQGALRGTVRDAQGVIPGVTVTLTNEATGVSRDTVTNAAGEFSFPAIDPSAYTVAASVTGYKEFERKGVRV